MAVHATDDVNGDHQGIETKGNTYTKSVDKRGMLLQQVVDITSTNTACMMGYYSRKGSIAPGSNTDIVLIDSSIKKTLLLSDMHLGDYSICTGWDIEGCPAATILSGKVMVENAELYGNLTDGQFIPQRIDSQILSRPMC